jgi:hypothetical protein
MVTPTITPPCQPIGAHIVALGAGVCVTPRALFAQQPPTRVSRIGVLNPASASTEAMRTETLRAALQEAGWRINGRRFISIRVNVSRKFR